MSYIFVENLHWGYNKDNRFVDVLKDVQLRANQGEVLAILGQSGSGKSSLLNILSGILPAARGQIRVADQQLDSMNEQQRTLFRRRHVGFVYQFFNLIPTLTVSENLELALELNNCSRDESRRQAAELLETLKLEDRSGDFPDRLSGGEQQRVAIGRALIHRPSLVLADEPTGNLDAQTGQRVLELLFDQVRKHNACMIIVTHSKTVADRADRLFYLADGQLQSGDGALSW